MVKWISHNQGTFIAVIITVILLVWTFGCESTVTSPISNHPVTRSQLKLEVDIAVKQLETDIDNLQKQALLSLSELDKADVIKRKLFEFASMTAAQGTFNPTGIITLAGTLLGFGFGVDNRIKDKVIKNRPINKTITTEV